MTVFTRGYFDIYQDLGSETLRCWLSVWLHHSRLGEGQGEAGGAGKSCHVLLRGSAQLGKLQNRRLWSCMGEEASEIRGGEISSDQFRGVATYVVS